MAKSKSTVTKAPKGSAESNADRVSRLCAQLRGVRAAVMTTAVCIEPLGVVLGDVGLNLRLAGLNPLNKVIAELETSHV